MSWWDGLNAALKTGSEILAAGISITAFALLLYAFSFNLKDRIARSFTLILICVVIVFSCEALGSSAATYESKMLFAKLQWVGILYLPPTYLQFSDAVLATTGKPSRGKRSWANRLTYFGSSVFLLLLITGYLVGDLDTTNPQVEYLKRTIFSDLFSLYYLLSMIASWINFTRAYRRTTTPTTRRRMFYLITGALAPALGSFPYLLYGSGLAAAHQTTFWSIVLLSNILVGGLIVMMSYSIAFFGVTWPDRVVKRRLFKWILRGPVTAIAALSITTLTRKSGILLGIEYATLVPIFMALTILVMEFTITLLSPLFERWLFYGNDRREIEVISNLADKLMTRNDLSQFLEAMLAAVTDRFQAKAGFIASINDGGISLVISHGELSRIEGNHLEERILPALLGQENKPEMFQLEDFLLVPMYVSGSENVEIIGILGVQKTSSGNVDLEDRTLLMALSKRIELALINSSMQQDIFTKAAQIDPQIKQFQQMVSTSRLMNVNDMADSDISVPSDLAGMVKDALTHYWGGPKFSTSPLMKLKVVRGFIESENQNPVNALRGVLKNAIESVKPEGERKQTGEWILYNILEMKFIQGKKVREVALKLAVSEADLYRKQRVAIEAVAKAIMEMEKNHP